MDELGLDYLPKIEFKERFLECSGKRFVRYLSSLTSNISRICEKRHPSQDNLNEALQNDGKEDCDYLKSLDPKEWKGQDHYAVLGLEEKRHSASFAEIKSAYRQKVLKHHPDKRKAKGEIINSESDYFTCITKAWEILGDYTKRRSYDSVDPVFDNDIPSNTDYNKTNFFEVFDPVFERNARWSDRKPVPLLGGPSDDRTKVEKFYTFWYNFESWREFSYEDEESKDRAQDREERKWIEKHNRAIRAKKKKEEMSRIRSLVDTAYALDPRISKFKLEDKEKKESQKRAKAEAIRLRQEELEKAQQEKEERQRKQKEEYEAALRAKQNALKAEREIQKRLLRKEKKMFRDLCKENDYFVQSQDELVINMQNIEKLCESLGVKELEVLNEQLKKEGKDAFYKQVIELERKQERERQIFLNGISQEKHEMNGCISNHKQWPQSHINLLIKAVNLFPAGTSQRWEVVANFINQHSKNNTFFLSPKDVLYKAKDLLSNDDINHELKKAANSKAYELFQNDKKSSSIVEEAQASERFESVAEQQGFSLPWTSDEQQLFEQALKTYPANYPDRWVEVAGCIPSRSKKECMRRYKDLVEMVKAKKAAEKTIKVK